MVEIRTKTMPVFESMADIKREPITLVGTDAERLAIDETKLIPGDSFGVRADTLNQDGFYELKYWLLYTGGAGDEKWLAY